VEVVYWGTCPDCAASSNAQQPRSKGNR
jgi:hypothetical protein